MKHKSLTAVIGGNIQRYSGRSSSVMATNISRIIITESWSEGPGRHAVRFAYDDPSRARTANSHVRSGVSNPASWARLARRAPEIRDANVHLPDPRGVCQSQP